MIESSRQPLIGRLAVEAGVPATAGYHHFDEGLTDFASAKDWQENKRPANAKKLLRLGRLFVGIFLGAVPKAKCPLSTNPGHSASAHSLR